MITSINYTSKFKKDLEKTKKQNRNCIALVKIINDLTSNISLAPEYRDHKLTGNYKGRRECHVEPDLLLIYCINNNELTLERLGTHSELFI